ncbi:MAG: response regulator transcription factor [FCB group bacterium]|nr:response regulator transcription factor [FCB group bacterium]
MLRPPICYIHFKRWRITISPLGKQPTPRSEIRIIIVDERKIFRQGLMALLTTEPGILVVGDTGNGLDAVRLVEDKKPNVIVANLRLPRLDGIGLARRVANMISSPEMVYLTNEHIEARMRDAFRAGARAYLMQDCDFKELVFAIRKASVGDFYLSGPAGHEMVLEYVNPGSSVDGTEGAITRREIELARLLADGYSNKEAAGLLNISIKTAENHRAAIMKKIRAKNVTDIVKYCIRNKIIES